MEAAKMLHYWNMDQKLWHLFTMEVYSVLNKNEILLFAGKWMELRNIKLSEISLVKETKGHTFETWYTYKQYYAR
jgi:hypothetical protein